MKTLKELDQVYRRMVFNSLFKDWRMKHIYAMGFYTGNNDIRSSVRTKLTSGKVDIFSCNLIAPTVNALLGTEIQNEYRIKVSVSNNTDEARDFEDGINQYFCNLQNKPLFENNIRMALKDAVIGGIGFVEIHYKNHEPLVDYINPLNIVIDFNDTTPYFDRQYQIVTWEDLPKEEIKLRYGENNYKKLEFKDNEENYQYLSQIENRVSDTMRNCEYKNRVFTVRYLEVVTGWEGTLNDAEQDSEIVRTIDPKFAVKLKKLSQVQVTIPFEAVICQGKVLKNEMVCPIVVNGQLPVITMVCQKDEKSLPTGIVEQIVPLQESFNISLSRNISYANTTRTFITLQNMNDREALRDNVEQLQSVIAPNAVSVLSPGDKVDVVTPNNEVAQQRELMRECSELIKRASGVEDETKGIQTNAVSGVAQRQRDISSLRTNAFIFNNFSIFKKRIGEMILEQLKYSYDTDIIIKLMDNEEREEIVLNELIEFEDGSQEIRNDITKQKWNISIEEAPANSTLREYKKNEWLELLKTPNVLPIIMKSKTLLGNWFSNPSKIIKELQESSALPENNQK